MQINTPTLVVAWIVCWFMAARWCYLEFRSQPDRDEVSSKTADKIASMLFALGGPIMLAVLFVVAYFVMLLEAIFSGDGK